MGKNKTVTVYLPQDEYEAAKAKAEEEARTMSNLIRVALKAWIKNGNE